MVISEVIEKLQEIQNEHGDLEVKAYDDGIYFPVDEYTLLVHNNVLLIRG